MHSGTTTSTNTGPVVSDATSGSGYYAYVEDSTGDHPAVNLITPCLDLGGVANPRLTFQLQSFNSNPGGASTAENLFSVDVVSFPGEFVTPDAFGPIGHDPAFTGTWASSDWQKKTLNLTAFAGQTIQLVFRASSDNSGATNTFYHDIALDDVSDFDFISGPGQPGQSGVAILDINDAQNMFFGAGGPYSGDNSPFTTNNSVGVFMAFTLSGEPNQPIVLLIGPMNPVAASYPNIGQFDIGGPVDPMGIPTLIQVIGDGFNPTTFINVLFNTAAAGQTNLLFTTPPLPLGVLGGFQAAIATSNGFYFAISNAVELTIV